MKTFRGIEQMQANAARKRSDDMNLQFCSILLQQAMRDLTANELAHFRKNVGCLKMSSFRGYYLVEWPKMGKDGRTFALEVQADNAREAKAKAINNWLEHHAPIVRANIFIRGWESVA